MCDQCVKNMVDESIRVMAADVNSGKLSLGDLLYRTINACGDVKTASGIVTVTLHNGEVWDFTVPQKK